MAKSKKFKKRLFMVQRELNVSAATLEEYLEEEGYASALQGKGLNAKITDEGAYLDLLEAFADDQETHQRVQEMRAAREAEAQAEASGDGMPAEPAAEAAEEEEAAAAEAAEGEPEEAVAEEEEEVAAEAEEEEEAVAEVEEAEEEEVVAEAETDGQAEPEEAVAEEEEVAAEAEEEEEAVAEAEDAEEEGEEDEEEEDDTLKANRYRLSGPNVVGKVNLEEIKEKARERRKKRRRKRKERKEARQKKKQKKQKKQKKKQKKKLDEEDIEAQMQKTLNELEQGVSRIRQRRRRQRRERHEEEREREAERRREEEKVLNITEFISTGELANLMEEDVTDVIRVLMDAGRMVSINQRLDAEAISYVADEFGYEVEFIDEFEAEEILLEEDAPEDLEPRAPVVTVMGHVDHGKTSLLDYVRAANVVAGEAGGITQHIGAYRVNLPDNERDITFLDTPGHEAFTAMRARGAKATDLVILVVAADDGVMPQTVEAINHAQAAEVPIVVAINKMDLPEANPQRVMQELTEHNILVEPYGGTVQCAEISAETGEGINDLLEKVLLESDLLELKANPNRFANGIIVESRLEKGRGNVATVLVQNGTLEVGDNFVGGIYSGRVRAMFDERDQRIEKAGPSQPALVLGFNGSPEVGDQFVAMEDESEARGIAQRRQQIHREQQLRQKKHITLEEIGRRLAIGEFHELNLIIKADVGGSVEAVSDALMKLKTEEVAVNVIHTGVGAITENDVMLASASDAVILGFQVRPRPGARQLAEQEEIDVRTYSVIYEAVEDVRLALEGLLSPERSEETTGMAEVRETFKVPGVGTVAGGYVTEGQIKRNDKVRVVREGVVVYDGTISSLKRFKEDVREVQTGYEFGIGIENFDDIKVGDEIEAYEVVETRRTLEV